MTDPQHQDAAIPPSADGDVLRVEHVSKTVSYTHLTLPTIYSV